MYDLEGRICADKREKEIVKEVVFDCQGHIILLSKKKKIAFQKKLEKHSGQQN